MFQDVGGYHNANVDISVCFPLIQIFFEQLLILVQYTLKSKCFVFSGASS